MIYNSILKRCINYIYNNLVKAGICNKPAEYPYSKYKRVKSKGMDNKQKFIDVDEDKNAVCAQIINNYLIKNNCNMEELRKKKQKYAG